MKWRLIEFWEFLKDGVLAFTLGVGAACLIFYMEFLAGYFEECSCEGYTETITIILK
jgi:hypothetical protein